MFRRVFISIIVSFLSFAGASQAATVSISFSGNVGSGSGLPFTNFFPLGTTISGDVQLNVNDTTNAVTVDNFSATVGLTTFSQTPLGSSTVEIFDNGAPLAGPISADGVRVITSDVQGPMLFGITASTMNFRILDFSDMAFDTDMPSALDFLALNSATISFSGLFIIFEDAVGDIAGSLELENSDLSFQITTDAVPPVPLPASGALLLTAFAILAFGRTRTNV